MSRFRSEEGAILVETAITLPLILLLTIGGISVLWWLHNRAMMHLVVSETARDRAGDGTWVGYINDARVAMNGPQESFGVPNLRTVSFHLPTAPPFVVAAACSSQAGVVPRLPGLSPAPPEATAPPLDEEELPPWFGPVFGLSRELRNLAQEALDKVNAVEQEAEGWADEGISTAEQLLWYRRATENLLQGEAHQRRQTVDFLVGALAEEIMQVPCQQDANGGVVLTAKAVIRGEPVYAQR